MLCVEANLRGRRRQKSSPLSPRSYNGIKGRGKKKKTSKRSWPSTNILHKKQTYIYIYIFEQIAATHYRRVTTRPLRTFGWLFVKSKLDGGGGGCTVPRPCRVLELREPASLMLLLLPLLRFACDAGNRPLKRATVSTTSWKNSTMADTLSMLPRSTANSVSFWQQLFSTRRTTSGDGRGFSPERMRGSHTSGV